MNQEEKHIAEKIGSRIREKDATAEIILYGSRARGQSHEESDWDILILLSRENVSLKTEQEFRHHLFDLELEIGKPISVYVYSRSDWENRFSVTPFYRNIRKEGVLLV